MAQPAVRVAKAVYVRQLVNAATKLPASFGGADLGKMSPGMLGKPSPQLRKAQDHHRAMLQASTEDVTWTVLGSSSAAECAWQCGFEPCRLHLPAK